MHSIRSYIHIYTGMFSLKRQKTTFCFSKYIITVCLVGGRTHYDDGWLEKKLSPAYIISVWKAPYWTVNTSLTKLPPLNIFFSFIPSFPSSPLPPCILKAHTHTLPSSLSSSIYQNRWWRCFINAPGGTRPLTHSLTYMLGWHARGWHTLTKITFAHTHSLLWTHTRYDLWVGSHTHTHQQKHIGWHM